VEQIITANIDSLINIGAFVSGCFASLSAWAITSHLIGPTVDFSEEIVDYETPSGARLFQCAFENAGKRSIVDAEIQVRFCINGFLGTKDKAYFSVRTNASRVPELLPGKGRKVRVFDTREQIEFVDIPSLSLRRGIESCTDLYEVFMLSRGSYLRVHVFGYDSFTGVRKHFKSPQYNLGDIWKGRFDGLDVVEDERVKEYRRGLKAGSL